MKKINTHGIKMIGLKKASGNTFDYGPYGNEVFIYYNKDTGEVTTRERTYENARQYDWYCEQSTNTIFITSTVYHYTMQYIANIIAWELTPYVDYRDCREAQQ